MRRLIVLLAVALAGSTGAQPFDPGVGGSWAFSRADGLCRLERSVGDFGSVRFVATPGGSVRLEVLGHRELFAAGSVSLYQVAPPWHPKHPDTGPLGQLEQRAGSMLLAGEPLATQVLMSLYQGYETHVQHGAWYGGGADLRIGTEHLRRHYQDFVSCQRNVTSAGWSSFERTRVEYASNEHSLSPQDQNRLRRVADYVLADDAVSRIYVDGHTDDVGSEGDNLALSRRRAETVAGFLAAAGVPRGQLVIRYHADRYPVVRDVDPQARARNRRTTVRLERGEETVAAR